MSVSTATGDGGGVCDEGDLDGNCCCYFFLKKLVVLSLLLTEHLHFRSSSCTSSTKIFEFCMRIGYT